MIATALALYQAVQRRPLAGVVLLCVIEGALTWAWGYAVGSGRAHAQAERDARQRAEAAQQLYQERVEAGAHAVTALLGELGTRQQLIDDLKRKNRHVPALVATSQCPDPGAVHLSAGAVELYDTALGGEQLPADSCGAAAAGTAAGAAQGCGQVVTADQFQQVSQANAERFGVCISRLNALTALLQRNVVNPSLPADGGHSQSR